MFYAEAILSKKGPLAKVWLAAHLERKLTKVQLLQASIPGSVGAIIGQDQGPPLALRLSGQLLLGVARIYARKARYLLEDCNEALIRIKMAFRPGAADITSDTMVAANASITLPEALTEFDILLPSSVRMFGGGSAGAGMMALDISMGMGADIAAAAALNTSRIQDITLAEQSFDVSMVARGAGGPGALGFGEEDLLGRDDDFRLDLDEDFVFSPGPNQGFEALAGGVNDSTLEPEVAREAMAGVNESMAGIQADDISLLGKRVEGLNANDSMLDITREDLAAGLGGADDVLRFGDDGDLAMASGYGDASMVPNTQEAALQEAEAQVLAAGMNPERPGKRRRLNLADLVSNESTSLAPEEIRARLHNPADIVRVPTYLPPTQAARLESVSSAAAAMRLLSLNTGSPFAALFAPSEGANAADQEAPIGTRFDDLDASVFGAAAEDGVPEYAGGDNDFRLDFGEVAADDEISFAAQPQAAAQELEAELLLANKSVEQLERLEEESFQRQAEAEQQHSKGLSLFANYLPVRDEQLSLHASGLGDTERQEEAVGGDQPDAPSSSSNAGYSTNTIRAIHLLNTECSTKAVPYADSAESASAALSDDKQDAALSYMGIAEGTQRHDAVKLFFELLVLKSKDFIDVSQSEPFEDIKIVPRTKLSRAAESIRVNGESQTVTSTVA
ncbi:sister chromatid cohesion protein 1 [Coemansia sp. Benny D115]|nr:sister chromatid cohesion protein 1 [Coemansia sp. Benny D115]